MTLSDLHKFMRPKRIYLKSKTVAFRYLIISCYQKCYIAKLQLHTRAGNSPLRVVPIAIGMRWPKGVGGCLSNNIGSVSLLLHISINADGNGFGHGIGVYDDVVGLEACFFAGGVVLNNDLALVAGGYGIVGVIGHCAAAAYIGLANDQWMCAGVLETERMPYGIALRHSTKAVFCFVELHGCLEHVAQLLGAGAGFFGVYLAVVAAAILAV